MPRDVKNGILSLEEISPMNTAEYLERQPRALTIAQGLALVALVGILYSLIPFHLSLEMFFLIPVSLVAWCAGPTAGIGVAIASAIAWLTADGIAQPDSAHTLALYWNAGMGLAFFLAVIAALSASKRALEREKGWARTDDLTGTVNKRYFLNLADSEMSRSRRYGRPFTVAYLDIDNFGSVNDRLGRSVGDTVLRTVAETIQGRIRSADVAAHLGDDEFAILFPETPAQPAQLTVRRIHKSLLAVAQKNEWPVSFTIAIATFVHPPPSTEQLLKTMGTILASAKQCGKNTSRHEVCDSTTAY